MAGALLGATLGCGGAEASPTDAGIAASTTCTDGILAPADRAPTWAGYLVKGPVGGPLAVDATDLFFYYYQGSDKYALWAIAKGGGQPRLLVPDAETFEPTTLVSDGPWLYVARGRRKKADPQVLHKYPDRGTYLGHDATHFYLAVPIGFGEYQLEKVSKQDDAERTVLAAPVLLNARVFFGYVIWRTSAGGFDQGVFERVSTEGGRVERIALPTGPLVAADCNYLYFAGPKHVWRMRRGGSQPVPLGNRGQWGAWEVDSESLYSFNGGGLLRTSLRTGDVSTIAFENRSVSRPSLALDDTTIYYGTSSGITVARK